MDKDLYDKCIELANLLIVAIANGNPPMGKTLEECRDMLKKVSRFVGEYEARVNPV